MTVVFEDVQYLAGTSGATTKRTQTQRTSDIFNVMDYGAVGDGTADDGAAIMLAITAVLAVTSGGGKASGGTVYFPAGTYRVTSSLTFTSTGNAPVRLVGAGMSNGIASTTIYGDNVAGYVIDQPDYWPNFTRANATSYLGGVCVIWTTGTTVWSCLRPGTSAGSAPSIVGKVVGDTVTDGTVTWKMLSATLNANANLCGVEYMEIRNTSLIAGDGAVRIDRLASGVFIRVRFGGFNALHASGNAFGGSFIGCELSGPVGVAGSYGAIVGQSGWIGSIISGFDVGLAHYGADIVIQDGHIENNNTAILLGMDPTGANNISHGPCIIGNSFENNNTCLNIQGASALTVSSNNFTGVVSVSHAQTTQTGTTTSGSAVVTGLSDTSLIQAGNIVTSASGIAALSNVLSVDSPTQVTMTKNATATGSRSILFQETVTTGIKIGNTGTGAGKICNNTIGMACSSAGIDLTNADAGLLSFENNSCTVAAANGAGAEIIYPTMDKRAGIAFINNGNLGPMPMTFAALPGQAGVTISTPTEGMTFDITDCNTATFLATAAAGGTGATAHRRVRYNAASSVWQVVG